MKEKIIHCISVTKMALESAEFMTIQGIMRAANVSRPTAARAIQAMKNTGAIYAHNAAITRFFKSHDDFIEWEKKQKGGGWRSEIFEEDGEPADQGIKFVWSTHDNGIFNLARNSPVYRFDQLLRGVRG
ncbi:hypothetical protein H4F47_10385 [Pectobacterium brasiliense]|uniref:hypothetical protein n=1 Tax=Pectobacterium brasiliense TaxID=180957 RepID=UPI001968D7CB|nr:hypothetical protein [Pectobacterium brasiliense]MBN3043326.1 hypothetical protein [Pectobacterium brasiliense]